MSNKLFDEIDDAFDKLMSNTSSKLYSWDHCWVLAKNEKEATEIIVDDLGLDPNDINISNRPIIVDESEMEKLKFYPDYDNDPKWWISFKEEFKNRLAENPQEVGIFAYDLSEI